MARAVMVEVTCDVCSGAVEDPEKAESRIGLDDVWYTVDLCGRHRSELTQFLDSYMSVGTLWRPNAQKGSSASKSKRSADLEKVRQWAQAQGMQVSKRGRISAEVQKAYNEATASSVPIVQPEDQPDGTVARNPDEVGGEPADTARTVSLKDATAEASTEPVDEMAGTAASMTASKPKRGSKTVVGGTRNPDGTPVKAS